ncbi:MAG: histidine phosphatase family protein [Clostridia bacterium]|nr:histidine phosphatase family protein [Clostridia bacterium]
MKVGLVRHFRVLKDLPDKKWVTSREIAQWFEEYDTADIEIGEVDLFGVDWQQCYSSDLPRAVGTAQTIYQGNRIELKELREFQLNTAAKDNLRLPFILWAVIVRIRTFASRKYTSEFEKQIAGALDEILGKLDENVLIVSHAFTMMFLKKELKKRGFKGPEWKRPENGKLYIFER